MLLHTKKSLFKFCFSAALILLSASSAMANGKFYGQYSTPELVMGGKESKLSLTPSAPGKCITGLGSSDKSWLTYYPLGTDDNNTGIDVKILLDPDTIDRTGFIWVKSNYNPSQPYDTIYVRQPGTRCINPKQGSVGQQFFVAFMENGEQNLPGYLYLYASRRDPKHGQP